MAKKSAVEKNNRRRKMVDRFAARREALKAVVMNRDADPGERFEATIKLAGSDEWKTYGAGESFNVPGNSSFEIKVEGEPYHYICHFG